MRPLGSGSPSKGATTTYADSPLCREKSCQAVSSLRLQLYIPCHPHGLPNSKTAPGWGHSLSQSRTTMMPSTRNMPSGSCRMMSILTLSLRRRFLCILLCPQQRTNFAGASFERYFSFMHSYAISALTHMHTRLHCINGVHIETHAIMSVSADVAQPHPCDICRHLMGTVLSYPDDITSTIPA